MSTVGASKKAVQAYIRNQEAEDIMAGQLSFKGFEDPFRNLPELEDDSPEVPADSEANQQKVTPTCGWPTHYTPVRLLLSYLEKTVPAQIGKSIIYDPVTNNAKIIYPFYFWTFF